MTPNIASLAVAAALAGLLAAPTAGAQEQPFASWFKYDRHVEADWQITGDPDDPQRVFIRRKNPSQDRPKQVLVIYPRPSSAYDIAITKVLDIFESKELNADFTVVNFQLKDENGHRLLQFAEQKPFDLVFTMGSESTAWVFDNYKNGTIPVVSICSKDPVQLGQMKDYDHGSGTNFAFTSLNVPVEVQLTYILDLKPKLKNLGILVDSKNKSAVQTQAEPIAALAREKSIRVIMVSVQTPAKAREELAQMLPQAVQAMRANDPGLDNSVFLITGSTSVFREIATINANADRVPIVSMIPEIVTAGRDSAVLAMGISFESNAHLAAIYGADILTGRARAGDLKVGIVSPPDIAISFLKAREIGLRIPFEFFETATFIYDYEGRPVRTSGGRSN